MINSIFFASLVSMTIATGGAAVISESTSITIGLFIGGVTTLTAAAYYLGKTLQRGNDQRDGFANDLRDLKFQVCRMNAKIDKLEERNQ